MTNGRRRPGPPASFERFEASELYCGQCRQSRPVRERLLLVLPDGELFEYVCRVCGAQLGKRRAEQPQPTLIV